MALLEMDHMRILRSAITEKQIDLLNIDLLIFLTLQYKIINCAVVRDSKQSVATPLCGEPETDSVYYISSSVIDYMCSAIPG